MKPVVFENTITRERWLCDDMRNVSVIDGEEYLAVRKVDQSRLFLIRRTALTKVTDSRLKD